MSERGPSHCLLSLSAVGRLDAKSEPLPPRNFGDCTAYDAERLGELSLQMQRTMLIGTVASGYVHDLNTLLLMIELMSCTIADKLPQEHLAREELALLRQANNTARSLSQQLLAFVRRRPAAFQLVDLSAQLECSLPLIARLVGQHVRVRVELAPGLWPIVADPVQIDQLLLNLLLNARDACPDGGTVTIGGANIAAGPAEDLAPGEYVCLSVADTGRGMSHEIMARLFEPFYSRNELREGTGLGLFTCQYLVQLLGGVILAESAVGAGTTFRIYLPRAATYGEAQSV